MQYQISAITENVPKVIDRRLHAILDYTTAGTLLVAALRLRGRHPRASAFAFVNAASMLAVSMLTDYPGGVVRRMSFKTHGALDVAQATLMAVGPTLLGFAHDAEAKLFHAQAAMEAGVIAATDWESPSNVAAQAV